MRTIKFRGQSRRTGRWVYGFYVHLKDSFRKRETHRIYTGIADSMPDCEGYDFSEDCEEVDPKTVGQSTGLHDNEGNEVFEGDIIRYRTTDDRYKKNPKFAITQVRFDERNAKFTCGVYWRDLYEERIVEVLGNIHDNPGLLQQK